MTLSSITNSKMSDSEIIALLKIDKYSVAIKGLYTILPSLKIYILKNGGTNEDANDVFQDALVVLYKKLQLPDFKLTASINTYLHAVAQNIWMQELRRQKRIPIEKSSVMKTEFEYRLFEQKETLRQIQLQKDLKFREIVGKSIFSCFNQIKIDTVVSVK